MSHVIDSLAHLEEVEARATARYEALHIASADLDDAVRALGEHCRNDVAREDLATLRAAAEAFAGTLRTALAAADRGLRKAKARTRIEHLLGELSEAVPGSPLALTIARELAEHEEELGSLVVDAPPSIAPGRAA